MKWPSRTFSALCLSAAAASLPLSASHAASKPKKLPVCDGKHLRDVNIYGSVLPGSPIPATVAPPAPPPVPQIKRPADGGAPPPPVPGAAPDKVSARAVARSVGSC